MKNYVAAAILSICVCGTALAGGGDWNEPPQQTVPRVVVIPEARDSNNTTIWVALVGAAATLGAAYITVRHNRQG